MATTLAPFGLEVNRHLAGGEIMVEAVAGGITSGYGTTIYNGVPVTLSNGVLLPSASGSSQYGVFAGWRGNITGQGPTVRNFWQSGTVATQIEAFIYRDPNISYFVQATGSVPATSVGRCTNLTNTASGNDNNGNSQLTVTSTLVAAGTAGDVKIIGFKNGPDNAPGDTYTILEVTLNRTNNGFVPLGGDAGV